MGPDAEMAVRNAPLRAAAHRQLAQAALYSGTVKRKTIGVARTAVRLAPQEVANHLVLGDVLLRREMPSRAARAYRDALAIDPMNQHARHQLTVLALRNGRFGAATKNFVGQLADDPTDDLSVAGLRAAAATALLYIGWVFVLFAVLASEQNDGSLGAAAAVQPFRVGAGVLALLLLGLFLVRFRITAGSAYSRFVHAIPRVDRFLLVSASLVGVAVLVIFAGTIAQGRPATALFTIGALLLVLLEVAIPLRLFLSRGRA